MCRPKTCPELPGGPSGWCLSVIAVLLTLTSARYGYHRDELYFLAAGHHLAWGYPDQGPLVPFVMRVFDALGGGSLAIERVPATACSLGVAIFGATTARELGGKAFAQTLTATVVGLGGFVLAVGHIFVTATVDMLVWTVVIWLAVRIIRTGRDRLWLVAGAVAGVGLLNKDLPEVLLAAIALALAVVPEARRHLSEQVALARGSRRGSHLGSDAVVAGDQRVATGHARARDPRRVLPSRQPHRLRRRAAPPVRTRGHVALGVGCHQAVA